jgi:hypothetical protein
VCGMRRMQNSAAARLLVTRKGWEILSTELAKISVESLKPVTVLFPGDVYDLAVFLLKVCAAQDAGKCRQSQYTLRGLAGHYANLTDVEMEKILEVFRRHGLPKAAVVDP